VDVDDWEYRKTGASILIVLVTGNGRTRKRGEKALAWGNN